MKPSGRPPSALGSRDAPINATLRGRNRASSTGGSLSSPTAGAVLVMTETLFVDRWGFPQASLLEATRLRMILNMRETARAAGWPCRPFRLVGGHPAVVT